MRSVLSSDFQHKTIQGSLTVWCVLTLVPGAVLFLSLLMVCRFQIEKNDAGRIQHLSGKAALTIYDGALCDRYGLYGTAGTEIEQNVRYFLSQNQGKECRFLYRNPLFLLDPVHSFPSLFQYQIRQIRIDPGCSLQNQETFLKQVKEVMKYRVLGELVSFLSEQIQEIGKNHHLNGGLEASYAVIQQELVEYQELYQRLTRVLYSDSISIGVDGVVSEKAANPQRMAYLLESVVNGSDTEKTELYNRLKWWQENNHFLIQRNQEGISIGTNLEKVIQRLKTDIQNFQQISQNLSEEEREQDQKKKMIESVEKLKTELWGMNGETSKLMDGLKGNLPLLTNLDPLISPVMQQISSLAEISVRDFYSLQNAMKDLLDYSGSFELTKTKKSGGLLDFLGIAKWLKSYYVDLSGYAADLDLMNGETSGFLMDNPFSVQSQVSSQMAFFQLPERSFGEMLEDQVYLCEYGISAFRNLSDTIKEEEGYHPVDMRGNPFGKTILRNETEYLIHGSWNELQNVNDVQIKMMALRTIMNMAFLLSDPEKNAVIHSISDPANLVLPVIGGVAVYTAAVVTWSIAEAYLDFNALIQGEAIPLWKTNETWQSDLKGILKKSSSAMKLHLSKEGKEKSKMEKLLSMDYEMYLRLLLLLTPQETMIARMQSLIDMNLRRGGNLSFSLSNMVMDFSITTEIRGHYGTYERNEHFSYYQD